MYRPQTVEQYKIRQILEKRLVIDDLYIIPLSRNSLMVEDKYGIRLAFSYRNGVIKEADIPKYPSDDQAKKYLRCLKATGQLPNEFTFEDTTRWWIDNPSPLSHRQILGLGSHMYHHYLKNRLLTDEEALKIASQERVTEHQFKDLFLWYLNSHRQDCWLGWMGIDMTGELYGLIWKYGTMESKFFLFHISQNSCKDRYRK